MERQGNSRGHVRGRRWTAGVLAGVAVLLAVIALVLTYLGRAVLRPEPFADRAVAALRHPAVRADLADHLTTVVLQVGGEDLVAVRPLIRSVAGVIVGSQAFAALFRHAVLVAHDRVVDGHGRTLALTIGDLGVLVQGALQKFAPGAAATIAAQRIPTLLSYRPDGRLLAAIRTAKHAYSAAWVLAVLAALAAAGGLALSPDRRRTVLQLGIGLLVGGLAIAALVTVGRTVAVNAAAPGRAAVVDAVWNVFLSGLRVQALVLAAGGAICAACAFVSGRTARHAAKAADARSLRRWRTHRVLPVAVALTAFVAMVLVLITGGGDEAPAATPRTCNGYRVLCNRRLNEVALAATHNSMASTTIRHWLFAQQDGTISDQLNQGIHGLLIDSYYGFAEPNGIVRTDLARVPKLKDLEQEIGPQATQAALRIRSRLEPSTRGKPGIFLCHGFCELGSITLASALEDLRTFLVNNPNEVVVVINQDEGVTPTDIEHAFGRAGLLDLVYRGPLGPFPTLRQMIDSNQRLVVMAENDAGDVPWYQIAYQHALQETPFRFRNADQLTDPAQLDASCRPNRGPSTAPLFLLNHWIDTSPTPRPSLAAIVNAEPKLLARVRTCERIRDHLPNLVAVDFYRRGGVLAVVNALNGIGR